MIAAALSKPGTIIENVPPLPGKKMEERDPQELDLDRPLDHREHALLLPALGQSQRDAGRARAASARPSCC